jgi:hypothetical protein
MTVCIFKYFSRLTGSGNCIIKPNFFYEQSAFCVNKLHSGRCISEAVSRWLPTAAARVRARVWQVEFVVDKVASGQVFSECFGFPCQNRSFLQLLRPHNHPGQTRRSLATS